MRLWGQFFNSLLEDVASGQMQFTAGFGGQLMIGHSLGSSAQLIFGNHNLFGQVIVNAAGTTGGAAGTWTGTVHTNGTTGPVLSPVPAYAQTSDVLGGGAIGQAPFQLHVSDCFPATSGTYSAPPASLPQNYGVWQFTNPTYAATYAKLYPPLETIHTWFYGPVRRTGVSDDQNQGVAVQWFNGSAWVDVTSGFNITTADDTDPAERELRTTAKDCVTYQPGLYRIVSNVDALTSASRLKCAYVTGTPDVAQFAHYFELTVQCNPADLGKAGGLTGPDGLLDNNDEIAFINLFFANDPRADLGIAAGFEGQDGLFDNNDFIARITAYFRGGFNPMGDCFARRAGPGAEAVSDSAMAQFTHTGNETVDRELNALWLMYDATADERVMQLITQTYFDAPNR